MSNKKPTITETLTVEELEEKAEALYDDEEYEEAVELYRKAAAMGGNYAQYSLGFCYQNGLGVEEDLEEAMKWFKIAADNGNEQAVYDLALCMFEECDYRASFDWFAKAADAGVDDAWYYLGWLFFSGAGPEYNVEKAEKCWSRVTNEDQSTLQYKIGYAYECWSTNKKIDHTERLRRFSIAANWMQLSAKHGDEDAKQWLKENGDAAGGNARRETANNMEPSLSSFWNALIEQVDGFSGLVFSADSDLNGDTLISNEYLYKDWFYVLRISESAGMQIYLVVDTDNSKDNDTIANIICEYLKAQNIDTQKFNTISSAKGRALEYIVSDLDISDPTTYSDTINEVVNLVSSMENSWEELDDDVYKRQKAPLIKIEPQNGRSVEYKYNWGKGILNTVLFRYGSFLIESDESLRDEVLTSLDQDNNCLYLDDWTVLDEDAGDSVDDDWDFPDDEFGKEAEGLYDEDGEEGLESLGLECSRDRISIYGPLEIQFLGYLPDSNITPHLRLEQAKYAPKRTIPCDLFDTNPNDYFEGPTKPDVKFKADSKEKSEGFTIAVDPSGPTTKLDFWHTFKPYIDQMRHSEFSQVKIKDDDCLDAKATVIVGAYNSILMRVSKKLLRLELYIDTETEAGNLQILDYIKDKIQVPPALKGKIEYERKEGRRAQRVCVSFPGFELTDRSCWGKFISEVVNVADDFFDAVEAPMRDLIK